MFQTKKLLIICYLITSIVFISGCTSNEKINPETSIDSQNNQNSGSQATDSKTSLDSKTNTQPEKSFMDLEHFIDLDLNHVKIESSNPNIEIVRFELHDQRSVEKSDMFSTSVLVQNNGDKPVLSKAFLTWGCGQQREYNLNFEYLMPGERIWLQASSMPARESIDTGMYNTFRFLLHCMSSVMVESDEVGVPSFISPELKNIPIKYYHNRNSPVVNVDSIRYEESDDSHKWRYITFGIHSNQTVGGAAGFDVTAQYRMSELKPNPSSGSANLQAGTIEYIKIPLGNFPLEGIKTFLIGNNKLY